MKMLKYIYQILFFSIFVSSLSAQIKYDELIDTSILKNAEFQPVELLNTEDLEFSPTFYNDGIVYVSSSSNKKSKYDINIGEAFFTLLYANLDSIGIVEKFSKDFRIKNHLGPCAFSDDEKMIFLTRNKKGVVQVNDADQDINPIGIYFYKYENGFWISKGALPINSHKYKVFHPTWDEVNNKLIFASDMPGGYGGTDLYSIKKVNGKWIELKNLGSLVNTEFDEAFPFIYKSKNLFFASKKEGGKGGFDMYFSLKNDDKYSIPVNLGSRFNSEYDDFGLVIDNEATLGYFTSSRPHGKGKDDIYKFSTDKPIFKVFNNYFTINVLNKENNKPIDNAKITFSQYSISAVNSPVIAKVKGVDKEIIYTIDPKSLKESEPVFTDKTGTNFIKFPAGSYIVKVFKYGFSTYSGLINTEKSNKLLNVMLAPDVKDTFEITFFDSEDKSIINNLKVKIEGGDDTQSVMKKDDTYIFILTRGNELHLSASSDDYTEKNLDLQYGITPSRFDVLLNKKQKYVDYLPTSNGEVVILKDIYYEYNSAKLTDKAKDELNKLAKHLRLYKNINIELGSHTDSRGKAAYNLKLSKRRSVSAKKYLLSKDISEKRIWVKGYGESILINHCLENIDCSDEEHAINRRTEVKVIKK